MISEITRHRAQRPYNMTMGQKCHRERSQMKDRGRDWQDTERNVTRNPLLAKLRKKAREN